MPLYSEKHIVDERFSKALLSHKAQPSGRVWNKVSARLFNSDRKRAYTGRIVLASLLLLLFAGGGWWVTDHLTPKITSYSTPKISGEPKAISKGSTVAAPDISSLNNGIKMNITAPENKSSVPSVPVIATPQLYASVDESGVKLVSPEIVQSPVPVLPEQENFDPSPVINQPDMEALASKNSFLASNASVLKRQNFSGHTPYPKSIPAPNYYRVNIQGPYAGFGQSFNSTWIIDHDAIKSQTLKYEPTFGTALMIQGGYNFNNRWGIEGAWTIHSGEGQKYKYLPIYSRTTSLVYEEKHISFNYMQVPVMMRYKVEGWSGIVQAPFFVNYSLGMQYGRLLSYSVDETKEKVSSNHLFRHNEYALVAGVDYEFFTKNEAFITIGLRSSLGSDLFLKSAPQDLEFDHPHNFLIGIHGALNFLLQKKQETVIR